VIRRGLVWVGASTWRVVLTFVANIVLSGWIYALLEGEGPIEGPWWAVVTGSTVGYGDQYPVTTAGRVVAVYVIGSSLLLVALLTARLTSDVLHDPHIFSDSEQKLLDAHTRAQTAILAAVAERAGIDVRAMPEYAEARRLEFEVERERQQQTGSGTAHGTAPGGPREETGS
jgi:voltage-gated potassium channel